MKESGRFFALQSILSFCSSKLGACEIRLPDTGCEAVPQPLVISFLTCCQRAAVLTFASSGVPIRLPQITELLRGVGHVL